jgi:hypothetical protein
MTILTATVTDASGGTASAVATFTVGPATGTAFGASINQAADLDRWWTTTGKRLPVVRVFDPDTLPATWAADGRLSALPVGTVVVLSFKTGTPAAVTAFLKTRPAGQVVYVSYHHEPEDDVENGSLALADYRAAWAAYGPAIRAAGCIPTLILMDWTLNPSSNRNWRSYYVVGAVDCIAWDSYNPGRKQKPPGYTDYAAKIIPPIKAVSAETGLPWGLGEYGSPIIGIDTDRVAWVRATRQVLADGGALWACWWDVNKPDFDNTASNPVMQVWA